MLLSILLIMMMLNTLGTSDVVPEQTREYRPEPFGLTKNEWAVDNRELITISNSRSSAGTTTLYVVPSGKTLYVTSIALYGYTYGISTGIKLIDLHSDMYTAGSLLGIYFTDDKQQNTITEEFTMPLKFYNGSHLYFTIIDTDGISVGYIRIYGYLE